ncbi:MAG: porin family protein [Steroidobacteraceae bacterium]
MKRAIVAGALLALGSGAAFAEDNDRGFYAGAGIGTFDFSQDVDGLNEVDDALDDFDFDDDDNAWKVFAGYRFMKYLSVELDYVDFGRVKDRFEANGSSGDYSLELSGLAPYVIGTLPVGPVELSAKVGYLFYDVDTSVDLDANDLDADSSSSEEDLVYGVGIGATLFERLALKFEYEEIDTSGSADASAFWLSGGWRF